MTGNWVRNDLSDIMFERYKLLERCNRDLEFRRLTLELCRRDPIFWINNFVMTSDPRNAAYDAPVTVPLVLYPKQEEYILWRRQCLKNRKWGLVAKSRDMGISVCNIVDQTHHWLFDTEYQGSFASRKEMLVDRLSDPSSLFQKIRAVLRGLPKWMLPKKYFDGYMKIINEDNGSSIVGEAGLQIGRGNRVLCLDWDEAAFTPNQSTIISALSQTTDCCIRTSTPNASSDPFADDYHSGNFETFTFHWKDDLRKNHWIAPDGTTGNGWDSPSQIATYPWYEEQKTKLDELTIAREIDIDFSSSQENICIPAKWVQSAVDFPIVMTNYKLQAGLDVATEEGKDKTVLTIVDGGNKVVHIEDWKGLNTTQTAYKAIEICNRYNVDALIFDCDGVGFGVSATLQNTPGLRFRVKAFHGGGSPSSYYWQLENKSSRDKFANRKAELWHLLSIRFQKTYETRNNIRIHPTDECISIPNHQQLINELSMPTMNYKDNGQLILQSKKTLSHSPDFADSLVLASANENDSSSFMTSTAHYS